MDYKQYRNGKDSKHILTETQLFDSLQTLKNMGGDILQIGINYIVTSKDGDLYNFQPEGI